MVVFLHSWLWSHPIWPESSIQQCVWWLNNSLTLYLSLWKVTERFLHFSTVCNTQSFTLSSSAFIALHTHPTCHWWTLSDINIASILHIKAPKTKFPWKSLHPIYFRMSQTKKSHSHQHHPHSTPWAIWDRPTCPSFMGDLPIDALDHFGKESEVDTVKEMKNSQIYQWKVSTYFKKIVSHLNHHQLSSQHFQGPDWVETKSRNRSKLKISLEDRETSTIPFKTLQQRSRMVKFLKNYWKEFKRQLKTSHRYYLTWMRPPKRSGGQQGEKNENVYIDSLSPENRRRYEKKRERERRSLLLWLKVFNHGSHSVVFFVKEKDNVKTLT